MADDDRAARIRRAWRYFAVVQMTGGFWTALIALWNHDVYGALSMACVAAFGFLTWRSTQ